MYECVYRKVYIHKQDWETFSLIMYLFCLRSSICQSAATTSQSSTTRCWTLAGPTTSLPRWRGLARKPYPQCPSSPAFERDTCTFQVHTHIYMLCYEAKAHGTSNLRVGKEGLEDCKHYTFLDGIHMCFSHTCTQSVITKMAVATIRECCTCTCIIITSKGGLRPRLLLSTRSVLRCVFTMDSANMLCMPLYSSVQGSSISFPPCLPATRHHNGC